MTHDVVPGPEAETDSHGDTMAEEACKRIADEIVSGALAPGMKLEGQVLADRYGISRTPVREALRQLVATGLVEMQPRKGFTVAEIGYDQLSKMFEALAEVEALCARFAAGRMSAAERRMLQRLHDACLNASAESEVYYDADNAFHTAILKGAHNVYMAAAAEHLRYRLAPFRNAHFRVIDRTQSSAREHTLLVAAIVESNAEAAHTAMRDHVTNSSIEAIEYVMAKRPHS